jgi:hypothetical protein
MISEAYPNKMTANYTINQIGQTTGLVYEKNAHCASTCPETWFNDTVSPSIHGEALQQTSTLSKENYAYDSVGRLLETQETPAGKGCAVRLYAYDEESNRTSLTTREPGIEGKCATEGGTVERHTYDEANRLTDEKATYETFGNITKLPATDAGGHELTSTYYVDGQVATQEQSKQLINYKYDPTGRTSETVSENTETKIKTTTTTHYAGTGAALTWTSEGTEKWTRNIPGIDGSLSAIQESTGAIVLEIHDLQGDIVGKAAISETETKLLSTYNSTEFGVPTTSNPPKYSWLGADGVASELTATGVSTRNGSTYIPEIGRALQSGPIPSPGSFPNGTATVGVIEAPYIGASTGQLMNIALQENAQREEAKKQEAEEKACVIASMCVVPEEVEGDPTHILKLLSPLEAIEWGDALCGCSGARGEGQIIEAIANAVGVEGAGELVEEFFTAGIIEQFGRELMTCGEVLKSNSKNRCAIELHTASLLGVDTYFPLDIGVGYCYYYKKSYKGEKVGLHCPTEYYKRGKY